MPTRTTRTRSSSGSRGHTLRGREFDNVKQVKASVKRGGMGDLLLVKDEGVTVRFGTEPDGWFEFFEHYDEKLQKYILCTDDCDYCAAGDKPSKRYLANVLDRENSNKVSALKLAQKAAGMVMKKYERYKTLLDRDYTITRDGTGFDTEYDVNPEPPTKVNMARYNLLDLRGLLEAGLRDQDGIDDDDDDDDDEDTPRRVAKRSNGTPVRRGRVVKKPTIADDDDEPPVRRARQSSSQPRRIAKEAPRKVVRRR